MTQVEWEKKWPNSFCMSLPCTNSHNYCSIKLVAQCFPLIFGKMLVLNVCINVESRNKLLIMLNDFLNNQLHYATWYNQVHLHHYIRWPQILQANYFKRQSYIGTSINIKLKHIIKFLINILIVYSL